MTRARSASLSIAVHVNAEESNQFSSRMGCHCHFSLSWSTTKLIRLQRLKGWGFSLLSSVASLFGIIELLGTGPDLRRADQAQSSDRVIDQ